MSSLSRTVLTVTITCLWVSSIAALVGLITHDHQIDDVQTRLLILETKLSVYEGCAV
jgi:hypothetical protein